MVAGVADEGGPGIGNQRHRLPLLNPGNLGIRTLLFIVIVQREQIRFNLQVVE